MYLNAFIAQASTPAAAATSAAPAASPAPGAPPSSILSNPLIFMVLIGVMMYVLLLRPQQQRAKQQAKLLGALKSGDRVATSSGIVGVVITVKDKTVTLRSADAKMEVTKASVTEILESGDASPSNS